MVCSSAKIEVRAGQVNHNLLEYETEGTLLPVLIFLIKITSFFQKAETRHLEGYRLSYLNLDD